MSDQERGSPGADAALELLRLAGPRQQVPPERQRRVGAAVRSHWRRQVTARRRQHLIWAAALAAASLVAAAGALSLLLSPPAAIEVAALEAVTGEVAWESDGARLALAPGAAVVAGTLIDTSAGGRVGMRLAGGGSLRLDRDTRVVLETGSRLRLEHGTAYLDSGASPRAAGMTVATPLGEVRDIGTQFEVRSLGSSLRVRVREGSVLLERGRAVDEIVAGQEGTLGGDGELTRRSVAAADEGWAWVLEVAPPFHLEGSSAAEFLRWVARETGLVLCWERPALAERCEEITLHGDVVGVPPDRALALVLPTCGLRSRVAGGALIVDDVTP